MHRTANREHATYKESGYIRDVQSLALSADKASQMIDVIEILQQAESGRIPTPHPVQDNERVERV